MHLSASGSRALLWLFALSAFLSAGMMRVTDALIPVFSAEFGVEAGYAALVTSSYAVAYGTMQIFFGPLGDRFGKQRVIALALLISCLGNGIAMLAGDIDTIILARVMVGASSAGIIPLIYAWIADTVAADRLQSMLARISAAAIAGMMVIQWLAAAVAESSNWRWLFAGLVTVLLLVGMILLLLRPGPPPESSALPAPRSPGVASSAGTGYWRDVMSLLADPWVRKILLVAMVHGACFFAFIVYSPTYLYRELHLSLTQAASVVIAYGVGGLVFSLTVSSVLVRLGPAAMVLLGGIVLTVSMLLIAGLQQWYAGPALYLLAGYGYYTLQNALTTQATLMCPARRGTAVSLFTCVLFGGIAAGIGLAGIVFEQVGFRVVFILCAGGVLASSIAMYGWLRVRSR